MFCWCPYCSDWCPAAAACIHADVGFLSIAGFPTFAGFHFIAAVPVFSDILLLVSLLLLLSLLLMTFLLLLVSQSVSDVSLLFADIPSAAGIPTVADIVNVPECKAGHKDVNSLTVTVKS